MRSWWGCQWRGTKRSEPEQFSNSEYFTTHNYGLVGKKWTEVILDECMYVCVWGCFPHAAQHHVCLIITPQSFLASSPPPSVPPPTISLVPSLRAQHRTKHTVMHRECEAQLSGSNSHHNYIRLLPHCLFHPPLSSPNAFLPKTSALFFYSLHNASLSSSVYVSL